jgi:hypothetical protein
LLPVAISGALLLVVASYVPRWNLKALWGLVVFGILLVLLSLLVSVRVDGFTLASRQKRGKRQLLNRPGPWARLFKFILGGVVIPIAALVGANLVELPDHETPMSLAIELHAGSPPASQAEQLAAAVLHADTQAVKTEGIAALRDMNSPEALAQLLRLAKDDPTALTDPAEVEALSKAIASYGQPAGAPLLAMFASSSPAALRDATTPAADLFGRYLAPGFEGVRNEVARERDGTNRAADVAKVDAAIAAARTALDGLGASSPTRPATANVPSFVMRTLLQMSIKQDPDLLAFARKTAADTACSDALRGQALLLVAKLGSNDDLQPLYAYVGSPSPVVQASALKAIADLETKLAPPRTAE